MSKIIKFKYLFKDDYNPKYINGANGGITTQGEIAINFYLERMALPKSCTYNIEVEEGGANASEVEFEPADLENSFVRVVENGVIFNYQTAKEIHKWLGQAIAKLEDIAK